LLSFLGGAVALRAEEIEVAAIRFNNVRPANGGGNWLEAAVALDVRPAAAPPRMLSGVRVTLMLGVEVPSPVGAERRTEYYRATTECVALEAGRAEVRFYLPPELVKRDQMHGDVKLWIVELAVPGRVVPATRIRSATALASDEARATFLARVAVESPANDGLLQPQYLTPFANEYPRTTPTFVRRENR
jgi:hypothetical protein